MALFNKTSLVSAVQRWRDRPLRWRPLLLVLASVVGCQAMAASRQITAPVALVIPRGLEGARQSFLQGLSLGEQAVRACGATPAPLMIQSLGWDGDPRALFPTNGNGEPLLPSLVVAPYAADLRTYSQLAQDGDARVLLAHQRGSSLDGLTGLDEQGRLWPLLPSRDDDLRALAQGALDRGFKQVMVVSDPSSNEGDWSAAFVTQFEGVGGKVLSYTQEKVQELDGTDFKRLALLQKDVAWLGPAAIVLAAAPTGRLAALLSEQQRQGRVGSRPAWVWLISPAQTADVPAQSWPNWCWRPRPMGRGGQVFPSVSSSVGVMPPIWSLLLVMRRLACWRSPPPDRFPWPVMARRIRWPG